jgi:hypothetical protein
MRRQRNRHHVIRRLGRSPVMLRMKLDPHRRRIDDAKIAIVRRIVALQRQRVVDRTRLRNAPFFLLSICDGLCL